MAYRCDYCDKGYQRGHAVSHAKNRTIRRFQPNLHHVRVMEHGDVIRRLLCTRCIRKADRPAKKKEPVSKRQPLFATTA